MKISKLTRPVIGKFWSLPEVSRAMLGGHTHRQNLRLDGPTDPQCDAHRNSNRNKLEITPRISSVAKNVIKIPQKVADTSKDELLLGG